MARDLMVVGRSPAASVARGASYIAKKQAQSVIRNFIAPFYDTAVKAAVSGSAIAAETLTLFTQGIGGSTGDPVFASTTGAKTYTSTNLQTSGGIFPQGQAFFAESMGIAVFPAIVSGNHTTTNVNVQMANDITSVCFGSDVAVGGGTTNIPLGVIAHWPAGYGIAGVIGGTGTGNNVTQYGSAVTNGTPQHVARMRFSEQPIAFNSNQAFQFTIISRTATQQSISTRWCVQVSWFGTWTDSLGG